MVGQAALDELEEVIEEDEEEAGEVCGDVALVEDLVDGGEGEHGQVREGLVTALGPHRQARVLQGNNRVYKAIPSPCEV